VSCSTEDRPLPPAPCSNVPISPPLQAQAGARKGPESHLAAVYDELVAVEPHGVEAARGRALLPKDATRAFSTTFRNNTAIQSGKERMHEPSTLSLSAPETNAPIQPVSSAAGRGSACVSAGTHPAGFCPDMVGRELPHVRLCHHSHAIVGETAENVPAR
jgi:hypothetical protein